VWLGGGNGSSAAMAGLVHLDILQAQGAWFQDYPSPAWLNTSVLAYAHVAGSSTAVYGLPAPASLNPVLFQVPALSPGGGGAGLQAWVGAIKLSCLVRCRYAPVARWAALWTFIVQQVTGQEWGPFPTWRPVVGPTLPTPPGPDAQPPSPFDTFTRATDWLATGSGLLRINDTALCPAPYAPSGGAAIVCMLEGYGSQVNVTGGQVPASDARMDCNGEAAMALALRAWLDPSAAPAMARFSAGLLDYVWSYSSAAQGRVANASDAAYGILAWGVNPQPWTVCSYGDDNARVLTASALALPLLAGQGYDTTGWARGVMRSALANLRLTAASGFRPGRINYGDLEAHGWAYYAAQTWGYSNGGLSPQPHYQAQMWTLFAWAYAVTGFRPFLDRAVAGVEGTMAAYAR
jgi:hypothetical protein